MMKIPLSIRNRYNDQYSNYDQLKSKVDAFFLQNKNGRWHYESRVKSMESYALKVESGRFGDGAGLEDLFACTIVVENQAKISLAVRMIEQAFLVKYKRPNAPGFTHKTPDAFPFDDLRIYAEWKEDDSVRPSGLAGLLFEVQIKTYLQHAWSIATHDLVYKNDGASWSRARIAYQVKAMLEHAELSISGAGALSQSELLNTKDKQTFQLSRMCRLLKSHWADELLPTDLLGLAKNTVNFIAKAGISSSELDKLLKQSDIQHGGIKPGNLSPYSYIVQATTTLLTEKVREGLSSDENSRFKIVVPAEARVPESLLAAFPAVFVRIGTPTP